MAEDIEIQQALLPLWKDVDTAGTFPEKKPLLAHYTSIATLERIMDSNELWFSNPLCMNDLEELKFGLVEGRQFFGQSELIKKACGTPERFDKVVSAFNHYFDYFDSEEVLDTYVFCLSEHESSNTDGLLSMWRGYGGNGNGAAIVFDVSQIGSVPYSPLVISKVEYASAERRRQWINDKLSDFATILTSLNLPDDKLYIAVWAIFERIKMFALFTKHHGFSEEKEWRVVYLKNRDKDKKFESMCHYVVGSRGMEPKLKFRVAPILGLTEPDLSLVKIIHQIILGPTVSHPLAHNTVRRMLERVGKAELKTKVVPSRIPFRSA